MKKIILTLAIISLICGQLLAQKHIAFLQKSGVAKPQVGLIQALKAGGYIVDTLDTPFNFETLSGYNLVIIGRSVSSADFTVFSSWNSLNVPVLVLSSFCVRDSRMKLINGQVVSNADGSLIDSNLVTNALPIANTDGTYDAVFNGVTTGAAFPYVKWFYDYLEYLPSGFGTGLNTGKPLVVLANDAIAGAGRVLMARWEPGAEAYPGAGIHVNYRSYMNIGADDNLGTHFNIDSYTDASLKLFLNEVSFLISINTAITAQPQSITRKVGTSATFSVTATGTNLTYQWKKDGTDISGATTSSYTINSVATGDAGNYSVVVTGDHGSPVSSNSAKLALPGHIAFIQKTGVAKPQVGLINTLKGEGYSVDTLYTPFNFTTLAGYDLVIVGRSISSSDFTDFTSWNSLDVPVLVLSSFCVRDSRMKLINGQVISTADGSLVDSSLVTNALPLADSDGTFDQVFNGVTTAGAAFPYFKWFYDYLDYLPSGFGQGQNTGKPLVALAGDASVGAGRVLMSRWEPGAEAYSGAGMHVNYRSYLNIGADDGLGTHLNMDNYTDASLKLFLNEVAFLNSVIINTAIVVQPQSFKQDPGTSVTFSVTAIGTNLTYQWKKDGADLSGATSSSYTINSITAGDAGNYTVVVSGANGSPVTSNAANLSMTAVITEFYVATDGNDSNPGTIDQPFATWQKGFDALAAGQTLYIRGGTYYPAATTSHSMYCGVVADQKSGTAESKYNVLAYPGETPVLDCRNITGTSYERIGILIYHSDYWNLKGLEITRCDQLSTGNRYGGQGLLIYGGNNNTIENCVAHHNGGPGMGSRGDVNETHFINCDSYSNWDEFSDLPGDNADGYDIGFSTNNSIIRMTGCRAWDNGDDGFDMYQYPGYSGIYYLTNCWAWHQGYWPDGVTGGGNGCGFKYGDDPQTYDGVTRRFTYNCVAFNNRTRGFSQELADVRKEFYNCISYHNKQRGWSFYGLDIPDILHNNVAFGDGVDQLGTLRISDHNSWDGGITVSEADFVSVDGTQLAGPRQSDGSLPEITFLHLAAGSDLIDAGIDIGLPFTGLAPDLGAFEFTGINNHPPVINDQSFEIDKKSPAGTVVGTIVASDPDAGQTLNFSIVSGNTGDAFAIDSITGVLTVAKDSALKADFALVVKVQDDGPGNLSSQATITINVKTVGIEPIGSNSKIKVYPNPVSDELTIELEGNVNKLDFEILNSTGVVVFKGNLSERIVIPTTNLSPGIYFIKLRNGKTFEFKKIVKS